MDLPAAASGPWIALGAVLGIALLVAGWALARALRSRPAPAARTAEPEPRDDLAAFREHPPGTTPAEPPSGGWVSLSPAPAPAAPAGPAEHPAAGGAVLAALALTVLLVVGIAAAVAAGSGDPAPRAAATTPAEPTSATEEGTAARLTFEGVVLEEHAVGVTVAHPELELGTEDGRTVAHLRLPTANCLTAQAPALPGDTGCRGARTEYADLAAPQLRVERDGDDLRITGRFATYLRPAGTGDVPSGRVLELTATVGPAGEEDAEGWVPAEGELRLGDSSAATRSEGDLSALRLGR